MYLLNARENPYLELQPDTPGGHLAQRLTLKRQATQQVCLTSLLGDGEKGVGIVYGDEKMFVLYPICLLCYQSAGSCPRRGFELTSSGLGVGHSG
jgi:hypothetical protein